MLRPEEIGWFYQEGANFVFPDIWESYRNHIPTEERHDLLHAYYSRLTDPDRDVQLAAARVWSVWEGSTSCLLPNEELFFGNPDAVDGEARSLVERAAEVLGYSLDAG